jgi:hypothetical protein
MLVEQKYRDKRGYLTGLPILSQLLQCQVTLMVLLVVMNQIQSYLKGTFDEC